jgi:ribonuclease BN (tRNA processing enzyme)
MTSDGAAGLTVDVLGAGPAYTDRLGSAGAAYLVRADSTAIVLDLGQGSFPRLAATIEPSTLDAVVISHLHPDHFVDLVSLRHYLRWEFDPPRRVRVVAAGGLEQRIDGLHDEPGFAAAVLDIEALEPGSMTIGALEIEAKRVTHTADSHAFRVALPGRPGLVYTGDCGRAEDIDPLIRPGDALLSEVSFGPGRGTRDALHLDGPSVGALGSRTAAGRILLTHLQMGFDTVATIESVAARYGGPVELVEPGMKLHL